MCRRLRISDKEKRRFEIQLLDLNGAVTTTIKGTVGTRRINVEPPNG